MNTQDNFINPQIIGSSTNTSTPAPRINTNTIAISNNNSSNWITSPDLASQIGSLTDTNTYINEASRINTNTTTILNNNISNWIMSPNLTSQNDNRTPEIFRTDLLQSLKIKYNIHEFDDTIHIRIKDLDSCLEYLLNWGLSATAEDLLKKPSIVINNEE